MVSDLVKEISRNESERTRKDSFMNYAEFLGNDFGCTGNHTNDISEKRYTESAPAGTTVYVKSFH